MSAENTTYFFNSLINGDSKGILKIYKILFPRVLTFIIMNKGNREDAEDIFQKTLLQFTVRFKDSEMNFTSSFEAYFFTACKNLWRRELNLQKRMVTNLQTSEQDDEARDIALSILYQEKWDLYQEKLEVISKKCKEVLQLYLKKMSYAEITKLLSYATENVTRQKVFKCRNRLSELIKKDIRYKKINGYYD